MPLTPDEKANHLRMLVSVMLADGVISPEERALLTHVAGRLGLTPEAVEAAISSDAPVRFAPPEDPKERFNLLFDVIAMMMADGEVDQREMKVCEGIASKLGFSPSTVSTLVLAAVEALREGTGIEELSGKLGPVLGT